MKPSVIVAACVALTLAGCGTQPIVGDQPMILQADQGIAAVMFDAPDHISQLQFAPRFPGGKSFEVPDTQGGPTLFMVPVQAGPYCLQHFKYDRINIKSKEDLGCFTVEAGKINYSGTIVPEVSNYSHDRDPVLYTAHHFQLQQFQALLLAQYPKIAAAYPLSEAPPAPVGGRVAEVRDELSTWIQVGDAHTHLIYFRNNTSWKVRLNHLNLEDCQNVAQACERHTLDMDFAPFEVKQVLVVNAADKDQPFTFAYHYDFHPLD